MDELPREGFRHHPAWLLGVAGLLLAQAGLAAALFGPTPVASLCDERPIVSGRHPLHLYHGSLGSETFYRTGSTACFDPAFQAGYPKTPIFDGGSRPAEFVLALAGGGYRPEVYKLGFFTALLFAPLAFVAAARGAGLPAPAACLAGVGGIVMVWAPPVRELLEAGDLDVFVAGLAAIVFVGWLARYTTHFDVDAWLVLAGVSLMGWYAHPLVWMGLLPLVLAFYVAYAPRHGLAWHLGLMGIAAAGLGPNLWWLWDWVRFWWLRQPYPVNGSLPWGAVLGRPADYTPLLDDVPGGAVTLVLGTVGLFLLARSGLRAAAWLLPTTLLLAVLAYRLAQVRTDLSASVDQTVKNILPLATSLAVLPASFAIWKLASKVRLSSALAILAIAMMLAIGWLGGSTRPLASWVGLRVHPVVLGFSPEQDAVMKAIIEHTTTEARILWEEPLDAHSGWNWSALLPMVTGRSYIGGLDPDAGVQNWQCSLINGRLNGQALGNWNDAEIAKFCRLYNVGWVVARSPATVDRWKRLAFAKEVLRLREAEQELVLFVLDRSRSFILCGSGRWDEATSKHICLSNLTPDSRGWVDLSLHYQQEIRVYPSYIQISRECDPAYPDDRVRLSMPGPVPRVMLVWEP